MNNNVIMLCLIAVGLPISVRSTGKTSVYTRVATSEAGDLGRPGRLTRTAQYVQDQAHNFDAKATEVLVKVPGVSEDGASCLKQLCLGCGIGCTCGVCQLLCLAACGCSVR